jgi:hypothetical protein
MVTVASLSNPIIVTEPAWFPSPRRGHYGPQEWSQWSAAPLRLSLSDAFKSRPSQGGQFDSVKGLPVTTVHTVPAGVTCRVFSRQLCVVEGGNIRALVQDLPVKPSTWDATGKPPTDKRARVPVFLPNNYRDRGAGIQDLVSDNQRLMCSAAQGSIPR